MANVGTAFIEIRADLSRFSQDLRAKIQPELSRTAKTIQGTLGSAMRSQTAQIGSAVGTAILARGIQQSIRAASALGEAQNKVNVVFGQSSDVVRKFAQNTASSLGQSERQALAAAGTFGNLFRAMGIGEQESADLSTKLVTLASDLASFNDIDPAEALDKLRAGLVGEAEPLRTLGVQLSETRVQAKAAELGFGALGTTLTDQEKVQARFAIIMEDTTLAQGDFARTSDSLANKQRILSAEFEDAQAKLGTALLPAMTKATGVAADLAGAFAGMPQPVQMTLLGLTALTVASPILLRIYDSTRRVAEGLQNAAASGTMLGRSLGLLGRTALAGGLILGLHQAIVSLGEAIQHAMRDVDASELERSLLNLAENGTASIDELNGALRGGADNLREVLDQFRDPRIGRGNLDFLRQSVEDIDSALAAMVSNGNAEGATEALRNWAAAADVPLEDILPAFDAYDKALLDQDNAARNAAGANRDNAGATGEAGAAAGAATTPLALWESILTNTKVTAGLTADQVQRLRDKVTDLQNTLFGATDAQIAYERSIDSLEDSNIAVFEAQANYNNAVRQFGTDSSQARDAAENLSDAQLAQRESASGAAQAGLALQESLEADTAAFDHQTRGSDALLAKLTDLKARYPELGPALDPYIFRLTALPERKHTDVDTSIDESSLTEAEFKLANLTRDRDVTVNPIFSDVGFRRADELLQRASQAMGDAWGVAMGATGIGTGAKVGAGGTAAQILSYGAGTGVPMSASSVYRPGAITATGNVSFHARNRAVDWVGPNLLRIFQAFLPIAGRLKELIYSGAPFSIKNGQPVPRYAVADHWDHVHVALAEGGLVTRPTVALMAERGPELVVPLEKAGLLAPVVNVFVDGQEFRGMIHYEVDGMSREAEDVLLRGLAS